MISQSLAFITRFPVVENHRLDRHYTHALRHDGRRVPADRRPDACARLTVSFALNAAARELADARFRAGRDGPLPQTADHRPRNRPGWWSIPVQIVPHRNYLLSQDCTHKSFSRVRFRAKRTLEPTSPMTEFDPNGTSIVAEK